MSSLLGHYFRWSHSAWLQTQMLLRFPSAFVWWGIGNDLLCGHSPEAAAQWHAGTNNNFTWVHLIITVGNGYNLIVKHWSNAYTARATLGQVRVSTALNQCKHNTSNTSCIQVERYLKHLPRDWVCCRDIVKHYSATLHAHVMHLGVQNF